MGRLLNEGRLRGGSVKFSISDQVVQSTVLQSAAETNLRGPEENHLHAVPTSGPHLLRALQIRGGVHRGDDASRAACQLHLQVHR